MFFTKLYQPYVSYHAYASDYKVITLLCLCEHNYVYKQYPQGQGKLTILCGHNTSYIMQSIDNKVPYKMKYWRKYYLANIEINMVI